MALAAGSLLLAVGVLAAPIAFGQSSLAAAQQCTGIAADAARLACYDRALRAETPETVMRGQAADTLGTSAGSQGEVAEPAAVPEPRQAPSVSTRTRDAAPEPASFFVTIVEVRRRTSVNESVFVTDEGEVWVQTDARRAVLPSTPFRAEIRPGALGSYFLDPAGRGQAVRVRQR